MLGRVFPGRGRSRATLPSCDTVGHSIQVCVAPASTPLPGSAWMVLSSLSEQWWLNLRGANRYDPVCPRIEFQDAQLAVLVDVEVG